MAVTTGSEQRPIVSISGFAAVLDFATRSHARAALVLVVVALLNILPGFFSIPPTDRDEARFAQATKQMIESGNYIDIRLQSEVRYKKPVGIYWLQAAAVKTGQALGVPQAVTTIWLYRLPSLFGAVNGVLLTYWAALAFAGRRGAMLAGLMMAGCLLLSVEGRIAKTDAMLLATCVAAMGALARAYLWDLNKIGRGTSWSVPAIFWTALAAGVLLKGPVIAMLVVLTVGTLIVADRSAHWLTRLRPTIGLAWFALLVLPWFVAIMLRAGESFFAESVGHDMLGKVISGQESHGAPPGFYFVLFWVTFWPGATLAGLATPAVWAARREAGVKFLLAWLVPAWLVFELVATKLPHYVLPLYPAIAILIARVMDERTLARQRWLARGTFWWLVMPVLVGAAAIGALVVIGGQSNVLVWPIVAAAVAMGFIAWQRYDADGGGEQSLVAACAAAILSTSALFGVVVPALTPLFPSVTLAHVLRDSGCAAPRAASAGYGEASLVFLAGTSTQLTNGAGAADFLRAGNCHFAFVEAHEEQGFKQRADAIGLRYAPGPRFDAINMANGRPMTIAVYRGKDGP
jgi:4-amino-4-deoxy-L-arabinose transferase-like glycosyltransferase